MPGSGQPLSPTPTDSTLDEPAVSRLETITALAVVAICALAIAAIAWAMPTSRSHEMSVSYRQTGSFGYSGDAVSTGSVYGTSGLRTGDPILVPLVHEVRVRFGYRLATAAVQGANGTSEMVATVQTSGGLSRDFPVTARSSFSGSRTTVTGVLPVREMLTFVNQAQHAVGAADATPTTVTLRPRIALRGAVHGQAVTDHFAPTLTFDVDGTTLSVASADGVTDVRSALHPESKQTAAYPVVSTNRLAPVPGHPSVSVVRALALAVGVVCAVVALWLARPLLRPRGRAGEAARIRALYGSRLVDVAHLSLPEGPVAELSTMEALAEIAKRYESMILHVRAPEAYLVWDDGLLYRYCPVPTLHPVGNHLAREA